METFDEWYHTYVTRAELEKILRTKHTIQFLMRNGLEDHNAPAEARVTSRASKISYAVNKGTLVGILLERATHNSAGTRSLYLDQMQALGVSGEAAQAGLYAHACNTYPKGMSQLIKGANESIRVLANSFIPREASLDVVLRSMYEISQKVI